MFVENEVFLLTLDRPDLFWPEGSEIGPVQWQSRAPV